MRRLITLGILLCMLSSAQRKPPVRLLTKEQMVAILVDLEVAKAMVWCYTADEDTARCLLEQNARLIYQAHNVDIDTFQKSYQYYLDHLETMKEIYEVVVQRLEVLQADKQ